MHQLEQSIVRILNPINSKNPSGDNIRGDSNSEISFYEIKNSRRSARDIERHNISSEEKQNPLPAWKQLAKLIEDCLTNQSKDFELACWLCEAWTRLYNVEGLYYGIDLLSSMLQTFAHHINPIDESTKRTSLQSFVNLNGIERPGALPDAINKMIVIDTDSGSIIKSDLHCIASNNSTKLADNLYDLCKKLDISYLLSIRTTIENTYNNYNNLCNLLASQSTDDLLPTSNIKNCLIETIDFLKTIIAKHGDNLKISNLQPPVDVAATATLATVEIGDLHTPCDNIDRHTAINMITASAKYFEQNEPHSPIPFLLKRAAKWAYLSLPELLNEIVQDENERKNICKLTGIN